MSGMSGMALARPLQLQNKPVSRVENFCATGSEALRGAAYAVASGAYDSAMAIGVEKVKDSGYQGLVGAGKTPTDGTGRTLTAAAMFAMCVPAYAKRYGVDAEEMREVLAHISCEEPLQRRPQPAGAVPPRSDAPRRSARRRSWPATCASTTARAWPTGARRRSSSGPRTRTSTRTRRSTSRRCRSWPGTAAGNADPDYDYTAFPEIEAAAADAYAQAGVTDPRHEIAMAEVHDCFTPAELLIMEDLGFAERGTAWKEVLAGTFDLHGEIPVNPDGGLKSFGHPVGASGLRMMFEAWLQLRHQAPEERQITTDRSIGLTHNLGGYPGEMVSFIGLVSPELG